MNGSRSWMIPLLLLVASVSLYGQGTTPPSISTRPMTGPMVGAEAGNNFRGFLVGWTFASTHYHLTGITLDVRLIEPDAASMTGPHRSRGIDIGGTYHSRFPLHQQLEFDAGFGASTRVRTDPDQVNVVKNETFSAHFFAGARLQLFDGLSVGLGAIGFFPVYLDHVPGYTPDGYRWSYGLRSYVMFHLFEGPEGVD